MTQNPGQTIVHYVSGPQVAWSFSITFINFTDSYLKLEDVCRRFRNPSILDIKIGRVSYDPAADASKREAEISKYPPLSQIGFQLLGMRV